MPSLEVGQILKAGGTRFKITELCSAANDTADPVVILEHCETGAKKSIAQNRLLSEMLGIVRREPVEQPSAYSDADKRVIDRIPVDMQSPAALKVLFDKLHWIQALRSIGATSAMSDDELAIEMLRARQVLVHAEEDYKPSTIRRAWQELNRTSDPRSLMPNFQSRGGVSQHRTATKADELLDGRFDEAEDVKHGRLRPIGFYDQHVIDVSAYNAQPGVTPIEPLSERTLRRRFDARFDRYLVTLRNKGKAAADADARSSGARIRAELPLEASQFDDTDGEVFLVDERSGLPWGRAFITAGIDEATRSLLGAELSEKPRDTFSALSALQNAILPKDMSAAQFKRCKQSWYAYGGIGEVQWDNALYFKSAALMEAASVDASAIPGWSIPHKPTGKQGIEYWNRTLKTEFTPDLPGWRGPKRTREGLDEGAGSAVLGLSEYIELFNRWLTDDYSNRARSGGRSPRQKWNAHFCNGRRPLMPYNTQAFQLLATLRETVHFRDSGNILRMGLRYGSCELDQLKRSLGPDADLKARIHPYHLETMYVLDARRQVFLSIPCIEPLDYVAGLTNYQQSLIIKVARENGKRNPSLADCVAARAALCKEVAQKRTSKKMLERRQAYRTDDPTSKAAATKKAENKVAVQTELEAAIAQVAAIDLGDNAPGWSDIAADCVLET